MDHSSQMTRIRATREEHRARMLEVERRLCQGEHPATVERAIARERGCSLRQARRYIRAWRSIAAHTAAEDALSADELLAVLLRRSNDCIAGDEPDWKASAKFLEQYARMRGWLDKRSTVNVNVSGTVSHLHALDGASDAEIQALQAYHAARLERESQGALPAAVVDSTAVDAAPDDQ